MEHIEISGRYEPGPAFKALVPYSYRDYYPHHILIDDVILIDVMLYSDTGTRTVRVEPYPPTVSCTILHHAVHRDVHHVNM